MAAARAKLKSEQSRFDPRHLVFIDETAVTTKMVRHYGRSPRGQRHKVAGVPEAIEAAGATLRFLPAYSPDLNPIEQAFSKLKAVLRKGAARTVTRLLKLIGRLAETLAPEECANYFRHAGYKP